MSKQQLEEKGFLLSEEALSRYGSELDYNMALNLDLKEIGAPFFPSETERRSRKIDSLANPSRIVLQVKSIKDTSCPKIEESRSGGQRLLRISLTDGSSVMHAVELSPLDGISLDGTPPGTKVRLMDADLRIASGFIILRKGSLKVLGGRVERLVESWENSRKFSSFKRETSSNSGPPPWVPFGKKMVVDESLYEEAASQTASLEEKEKKKEESHSEFNSQRQGAIEEAFKSGGKKNFGGGRQEIKDGKRDLTKREEIQQRRKGRRGNKENEGADSAKPPPSFGLSLSEFIPQKQPPATVKVEEEEPLVDEDGFEPIPPELQAQFDLEAQLQAALELDKKAAAASNNNNNVNRSGPNGRSQNRTRHNDAPPPRRGDQRVRGGGERGNNYQQPPTGPHPRQPEPQRRGQQRGRTENSDQDFGEWKNSTYYSEASQGRKAHYGGGGEGRTFSARSSRGGPPPAPRQGPKQQWRVNDVALARYWEDGEFYPVTIKGVSDTTAVVSFEGYGNFEEVLFKDLRPMELKRKPLLMDQRPLRR